jgi:hypothetical protein
MKSNSGVAVSEESEKPPPLKKWSGSVYSFSKFKNIFLEGIQNAKSHYPL